MGSGKQTTDAGNKQTITTTSQQATAGAGSNVVGAGNKGNITYNSLDKDVAITSLAAMFATGQESTKAVENIAGSAMVNSTNLASKSIDSALGFGQEALKTVARTVEDANAFLSQSQELSYKFATEKNQNNPPSNAAVPHEEFSNKKLLLIGGGLLLILVTVKLLKNSK